MKQYDFLKDGVVYPSLRRVYLECGDPTEHAFVEQVFDGDWGHWEKILNNDLIRSALQYDKWPQELRMKLRSHGMKFMVSAAEKGNANAARWLAEGGWEQKRGRPSKAEKARKLKEDQRLTNEFKDDLERLGLSD